MMKEKKKSANWKNIFFFITNKRNRIMIYICANDNLHLQKK